MNIKDDLKKFLCDNGLFEDMADQVMESIIGDPANEAMQGRWEESIEFYPSQLIEVLRDSAKYHALRWIDSNLPKAWFRPMFL